MLSYSLSSKALRVSLVSDGRPTVPRLRHGTGLTWTYARETRREDHTIWTAVAPEAVFTVRT